MNRLLLGIVLAAVSGAAAEEWSEPAVVRHDLAPVITYRAKMAGEYLLVEAKIEAGWHTFAMDNKVRAEEKLAGKKSLGIDRPTEIKLTGIAAAGPWYQPPPKDFSKAELRWYAFGFEEKATFATKARRAGGAASVEVKGQACTDSVCKNIDVELTLPLKSDSADVDVKSMVEVRK